MVGASAVSAEVCDDGAGDARSLFADVLVGVDVIAGGLQSLQTNTVDVRLAIGLPFGVSQTQSH